MKDKALVWHRAGLGDHFVAAGLVNHVSQKYQQVFVVCRHNPNIVSVSHLFSNLKNVCVLDFHEWSDDKIIGWAEKNDAKILTGMFPDYQTHLPWFEACYDQYGLLPNDRRELWPNPPDGPLSHEIAKKLILPNSPHVVIHNSCGQRDYFDIELPTFPHYTNVINFSKMSDNIFDWFGVLRTAQEIHVVDSSLAWILDNLGDKLNKNVHYHHIRAFNDIIPEKHILPHHPTWKIHYYKYLQWNRNTPWENVPYVP
jgi:hypothetical protein